MRTRAQFVDFSEHGAGAPHIKFLFESISSGNILTLHCKIRCHHQFGWDDEMNGGLRELRNKPPMQNSKEQQLGSSQQISIYDVGKVIMYIFWYFEKMGVLNSC